MEDNKSLYGEHYKFQDNSFATSVNEITQKIAVIMNDNLENAIVDKIIQEAKQEGVTDLFVLNKQSIMEAIKKQIPAKPVKKNPVCYSKSIDGEEHYAYDYHCPLCDVKVNSEKHHCPCGQALDWSDTK